MKKILLITLAILTLSSCQSHLAHRSIASGGSVVKGFLKEVADRSQKYTAKELEQKALDYIKKKSVTHETGNWAEVGLSEEQARQIKSLDDQLDFMPNVNKWVRENLTRFANDIDSKVAKEAFDALPGSTLKTNPYSDEVIAKLKSVRGDHSPFKSQNEKMVLLNDSIENLISSTKAKNEMRKTLFETVKRDPAAAKHIMDSIEHADQVKRLTGHNVMGEGCSNFNKEASTMILQSKATVDANFLEAVQNKVSKRLEALGKDINDFKNFDELPDAAKLTKEELEEIRVESFAKTLGYTKQEAKDALRRLKGSKCKVYS